jgi:hypothetical protein
MRYLPLLAISLLSMSLQAQTSAAGAANSSLSRTPDQASASSAAQAAGKAGELNTSSAATSNVSAELTKKIDTKNARVGDQVFAKTTSAATLSDGTKLSKGTRLLGQITDVHAKSSADKTSHVAFSLDRAVLHDGRQIPVHATLTSLAAPAAMASANTADDLAAGGGMAGASAGGRASGGGGLLGGAARTTTGATGGLVNSGTSLVGNTANGVGTTAGSALQSTTAAGSNGTRTSQSATGNTAIGLQLDRVPVTNLPGVTFSSSANAGNSGSVEATGRNIDLDSGTQLTLNMSASQQ